MKSKIKYFVLLATFAIVFIVFLSPMFVVTETNNVGALINIPISTYDVLFKGLPSDNVAPSIFVGISFAAFIVVIVTTSIQLFLKRKIMFLYYTTIIAFTVSFVSYATAGFIYQHLGWAFYLTEVIYAIDLIFILSFELLATKGL